MDAHRQINSRNSNPFSRTIFRYFLQKAKNSAAPYIHCNRQSDFQNKLNQHSEYTVTCDFADNDSSVLQEEFQSYHWNNAQAIQAFVIYVNDKDNILTHNFRVFDKQYQCCSSFFKSISSFLY
jgi:hypothetical protein